MEKEHTEIMRARGAVASFCFALVILGEIYLLRNELASLNLAALPSYYYIEAFFLLLLAFGIAVCCLRRLGWGNGKGRLAALALTACYAAFSIYYYHDFATAYLTGFEADFRSVGGALIALKLVLTMVGVVAGIPVAPRIDNREYSRRLRERTQRQHAEWAKAAVKGSTKELKSRLEKLKDSLTEEELAELARTLEEAKKDAESLKGGEKDQEGAAARETAVDAAQGKKQEN